MLILIFSLSSSFLLLYSDCLMFHIIRFMIHTRNPPVQFFPITGNRLPPWVKSRGHFLPHQLLICCVIRCSGNSLCARVTVNRCSRQQTSSKELEEVILSSAIHTFSLNRSSSLFILAPCLNFGSLTEGLDPR